jgi:hypothetical protein
LATLEVIGSLVFPLRMASIINQDQIATKPHASFEDDKENPFVTASNQGHDKPKRFSAFDSQLFALGPGSSPEQAKRALEAHLVETNRRIQDASRLGTSLVAQRQELTQKIKEVEKQQADGAITPELRKRLVEIEREFIEVGRDSARAFLTKSRAVSGEAARDVCLTTLSSC